MITVFGATGTTGAPLVDALLAKGAKVRAVTSDPAKLDALKAKGCEAVTANFTDPAALERACAGAERIYLVTPAHLDMRRWKANAIEAAKAAGVRHVVLATGLGASPKAKVTFGRWHSETQELLKQSGMDWTFVQPTYFMQNMLWLAPGIARDGHFSMPLGDSRIAWVDVRDIAAVGVAALTGEGHAGQAYPITGGAAISCAEMASILSEVCGRPIRFVDQSLADARAAMLAAGGNPKMVELNIEFYALAQTGKLAEVSDVVARITGRPPRSFGEFAADHAAAFRGR
jgi:uncharacterized protein YbjT (DUF2867 family)